MKRAVGRGTFLIASPTLRDPNFRHTVVVLCEHGEQGSLGLVVNRPSHITVAQALEAYPGAERWPDQPVFLGGPVQREQLLILHRVEEAQPEDAPVCGDLRFAGGGPDLVTRLLSSPDGTLFRFYLGYAGWAAKQLDSELEKGAWIVCPAEVGQVLCSTPDTCWGDVLRSMGGPFRLLAEIPADPDQN